MVDEEVLAAVIGLDEAEAPGRVESRDLAGGFLAGDGFLLLLLLRHGMRCD